MLIGFVGAACSGKTTTAALLFAALKEDGYVAEFLPEQARTYIAERRLEAHDIGKEFLVLGDDDQRAILYRQCRMERLFASVSDFRSLIITDGAALLALLYMMPEARSAEIVLSFAQNSVKRFDILFRCHPVKPGELYDHNRLHTFEQSQVLDAQLDEVMKLVNVPPEKVVDLVGPSHVRSSRAFSEVMERLLCHRN